MIRAYAFMQFVKLLAKKGKINRFYKMVLKWNVLIWLDFWNIYKFCKPVQHFKYDYTPMMMRAARIKGAIATAQRRNANIL